MSTPNPVVPSPPESQPVPPAGSESAPSRTVRTQLTRISGVGESQPAPAPVCKLPVTRDDHRYVAEHGSVHNWVELIYNAFGLTLPTAPGEIALLGIRQTKVATGEEVEHPDIAWTRVPRAADRGPKRPKHTRRQKYFVDDTTEWDDALCLVYTDCQPGQRTHVRLYPYTADPGADQPKTVGTPYLLEGTKYFGFIRHNFRINDATPEEDTRALQINSQAPDEILILREATKQVRIFSEIKSALSRNHDETNRGSLEFCAQEKNQPTILIHCYFGGQFVTNTSSGCNPIAFLCGSPQYHEFVSICQAATNSKTIPYLIVAAEYVLLYPEWKELSQTRVLRRSGLRPSQIHQDRYLPSLVTAAFELAVAELARIFEDYSQTDFSRYQGLFPAEPRQVAKQPAQAKSHAEVAGPPNIAREIVSGGARLGMVPSIVLRLYNHPAFVALSKPMQNVIEQLVRQEKISAEQLKHSQATSKQLANYLHSSLRKLVMQIDQNYVDESR